MHPSTISIHDYTYPLPTEKIAFFPLPERDASKLLVYRQGKLETSQYRHIAQFLPPHSLLFFNDTRVLEARLLFQKPSGATIELFCLEPAPHYGEIHSAMAVCGQIDYRCLIGGVSKWSTDLKLEKTGILNGEPVQLTATLLGKEEQHYRVSLNWTPSKLSFAELLQALGEMPLPPYIKRKADNTDSNRYQTIYARQKGSVAAPTAGLHFTPAIFAALEARAIQPQFLTLHVGAGTFLPVKTTLLQNHKMHSEWMDITQSLVKKLLETEAGQITVVGTTTLRSFESIYWLGAALLLDPETPLQQLSVGQWAPYEYPLPHPSVSESLGALLRYLQAKNMDRVSVKTSLLIAPGYSFKLVKRLITNFHQPQSTLLLLVAAFIGADWKKLYDYALEADFRFLSYGDGCLLERD